MEKLYDIFLTYGWEGLIGIAFLILLIYNGKVVVKKLTNSMTSGLEDVGKKMTDEITSQNQKLVSTIISQQDKLINHIINSKSDERTNHNNMLEKKIELSDEILSSLREIGLTYNAQRAFILEFHNSYQNLSGTPFAKYSCTYEWFEKGLAPIQFKCIDLPFSSLSNVVSTLLRSKHQQIIYDDVKKIEIACPGLYSILKDNKTKQIIYTSMYDKNNILIGLLVLEYHHTPPKINLNQLHIKAAELTSILNLRYKYLK